MNASMILESARALLASKGMWTQGAFARNRKGLSTSPHGKKACSFCMVGAIDSVSYGERGNMAAIRLLRGVLPKGATIGVWNDAPGRTQGEVLSAFDRAIRKAEK